MDTYWVPGVIHLETFGRWGFVELTDMYEIESGFSAKVEEAIEKLGRLGGKAAG